MIRQFMIAAAGAVLMVSSMTFGQQQAGSSADEAESGAS
jgi:hypothetical protein